MDEGWSALVGVAIGAILSTGGAVWLDARRSAKEARNLSVACAGELAAIAEMIRRRRWIEGVRESYQAAEQGNTVRMVVKLPPQFMTVSRVAMQHAGNLPGLLPSLIPRVVMLGDSIAADLLRLADDNDSIIREDEPASAEAVYAELMGVLLEGLEVCDQVVANVRSMYPRECASIVSAPTKLELVSKVGSE